MKKHILSITALLLTAALLTGCSEKSNTPNPAQGGDSSTTQSTSTTTESTESTSSEVISEPAKERFNYGEKEIPDIVYPIYLEDGRQGGVGEITLSPLDNMVFETRTFGDYTIRLVGDSVRTDKEHFPGTIYVRELRMEVENNSTRLHEGITDCEYIRFQSPYGEQFSQEYLIFEDKIGSYLDVYDMKYPVIALRYFNADNFDESIRKLVHFAWIEDDTVVARFFGNFAENTGVIAGGDMFPNFTKSGQFAVFAADDFKVENENTLIDETVGIRYTFDFDKTDDSGHYFRTEKIG